MNTDNKRRLSKSRWIKHLAAATVITTFMATTACNITVDDKTVKIEWPNVAHCIDQVVDLMGSNTPQEDLHEAISNIAEDCIDEMQ